MMTAGMQSEATGPVRVLQVVGKMNGGGVESVVMNYFRAIDRTSFLFDFAVCEGSRLIPREEIESLGGRVFVIPSYKKLDAYQRAVGDLIVREGYQVVHAHVNALSVFPLRVAKGAGVPVRIAHAHSTSGRGEPVRNAAKHVLRLFSNVYPTHRLACSAYAGRWLFGPKAPFEVLRNALDLGSFSFDMRARLATRERLGIPPDAWVIGHVGRFMRQKNHEFLIDAFSEVARVDSRARLLLVGEGGLKDRVRALVDERSLGERVCMLPQQSDVAPIYDAMDMFVLPSLYEGLPVVGVEAQANGLPCLFSDRVTREAAVTKGVRFLPLSASIWVQALLEAAPSLSPALRIAAGPSEALAQFDISMTAPWLASFYRLALEGERGRSLRV